MGKRIVITTIGSLGDLHPFIALALALKKAGHAPVLAIQENYLEKAKAAGLEAYSIMPSFTYLAQNMGMDEKVFVKRIMSDIDFMFSKILLPGLKSYTAELDKIVKGADAVLGSPFVFAGDIVAEKYGIPFIAGVLQPALISTVYDPIYSPQIKILKSKPENNLGVLWNTLVFTAIKAASRARYGKHINAVRTEFGLPRSKSAPYLAPEKTPLTLALYSPVMGGLQPDFFPNTQITGFPVFDSFSGTPETLDDALLDFFKAGPAPLVFTLGSLAVHAAEDFYQTSRRVAQDLGQRAILLTGLDGEIETSRTIAIRKYAPHSLIFPHCKALIHHGGIGTTGQALMAGKPQLVVPHLGDQWDNGARIKRLGVGGVLDAKKYSLRAAKDNIMSLIGDENMSVKAASIGEIVRYENGLEAAVTAIQTLFE